MRFFDQFKQIQITNSIKYSIYYLLYRLTQIRDNKFIRKRFGDDVPDVATIAKNISLILVNQHYSFTGPRPLSNQVIEVSGIHIKPPKPLPQVTCLLNYLIKLQLKK